MSLQPAIYYVGKCSRSIRVFLQASHRQAPNLTSQKVSMKGLSLGAPPKPIFEFCMALRDKERRAWPSFKTPLRVRPGRVLTIRGLITRVLIRGTLFRLPLCVRFPLPPHTRATAYFVP
jgi:hypothetical protein